jgi:hypothetical protein
MPDADTAVHQVRAAASIALHAPAHSSTIKLHRGRHDHLVRAAATGGRVGDTGPLVRGASPLVGYAGTVRPGGNRRRHQQRWRHRTRRRRRGSGAGQQRVRIVRRPARAADARALARHGALPGTTPANAAGAVGTAHRPGGGRRVLHQRDRGGSRAGQPRPRAAAASQHDSRIGADDCAQAHRDGRKIPEAVGPGSPAHTRDRGKRADHGSRAERQRHCAGAAADRPQPGRLVQVRADARAERAVGAPRPC